nr:hypothetical protein CFP56_04024 [Quercus suber]
MRELGSISPVKVAAALIMRLLLADAASSVCYDSSGNQNSNLTVCDSSQSPSSCCPEGFICLSNGLCEGPPGGLTTYTSYGCTVPGGDSGMCEVFDECALQGSIGVAVCQDNSYCCYGFDGCDCNNATQTFELSPGTIVTTITSQTSIQTSSQTSSQTVSTPSTSIGSATGTASAAPSSQSSNAVAIGVGVGVGVAVGVVLLAACGFWFWRRQKRSKFQPIAQDVTSGIADTKAPPSYGSELSHASRHMAPMEMHATEMRSELDSTSKVRPTTAAAELPSP